MATNDSVLFSTREYFDEKDSGRRLGRVGFLTLNRPERGNSISPTMGAEIIRLLDVVEASRGEDRIAVLVVTGAGKFFCTGMDLKAAADGGAASSGGHSPLAVFKRLKQARVPVVARINGPALAGGWGFVFCTDVRLAAADAWFSLPEVKRGIVPALISSFIVPEVGSFLATDMMLTGRRIAADEALRLRFISAVASASKSLDQLVDDAVRELLTSAPVATAVTKEMIGQVAALPRADAEAYVCKLAEGNFSSDEAMYGIACFAQKQQPDWPAFHAKL